MDKPVEVEDHSLEEMRRFRTPGFSRIRSDWNLQESKVVAMVRGSVDERIRSVYADAFILMDELYAIIREPELNVDGSAVRDASGAVVYRREPSGRFVEDWSRLTHRQKENLLFSISTKIYRWEQLSADAWAEAMMAKAMWEERFSIAYDAPISGTIEDRTARAKIDAVDERYFAIAMSLYSRKADAIVRSMSLLSQRIKDVIGS